MVSIELLGGACLRAGDTVLSGPPTQRHRIALLTLVLEAWPRPLARDRALALLWPERDDAAARRLLNLSVHVLRGALGESVIRSVGDGLVFDPTGTRCDLLELQEAIRAGAPAEVVRRWSGPLLEGFHLAESAEFMQWLDARRQELAAAYARALIATADAAAGQGDAYGAVAACRLLVAADPHSGEHARRLMSALDAVGDRVAAIRHATEHARRLRADLDLSPDPAVMALARELRRTPAALAVRPSVAVLPFISLDGTAEHEYFADGITEDVIAHLSKIRAVKVIARASVMPFKSRERPLREVAAALGVRTVLDGSVRHAGNRVRVVAALVEAHSGRPLWTETYDREITDIFAIQTDLALQMASALEARLSPEEHTQVRRVPTRDVEAYQLFSQGRRWFTRYTLDAMGQALRYFERAIERDPGFGLAHAALAMTYLEMGEHGSPDAAELFGRAVTAAETALALAPEASEAHMAMGSVKLTCAFDWSAAELHLRRAQELNPGGGDPYERLGRLYGSLGRYDEAVAMMQRAQELDPITNRIDLATMFLRAGRIEEAVRSARFAVEYDRTQARARATLGWALFLGGSRDEGIAELESAVRLSDSGTLWLAQLGEAYGLAGKTDMARQVLAELEERAAAGFVSPYHFAYVYTGLGELDRAMDLLETAAGARTGTPYGLKGSFLFARLRGHPRFRALMRAMNLES